MDRRRSWRWRSSAARPVAVAIAPTSGATAGGTHVVIRVASSVGLTSAAVGGVNVTGFAIDDATHVSGNTAAGAAGAVDVTVTGPGGTSTPLAGAYTYVAPFDPATLSPDGWWRGPFTTSPWVPTAPGDAHGNLVASGTSPVAGAPVNGITPAHFDAITPRTLLSSQASSNFIVASSGTLVALFQAQGAGLTPDQTAWYSEAPIITTDGGDFGFSNSVSGVRGGDGSGVHNTDYVPLAVNVWAMAAFRTTGTTATVRVSQASGTVTSAVKIGLTSLNVDALLKLGINWNDSVYQSADFLEVMAWKRTLPDSELDNLRSAFNARYGLTMT